MTRVRPGRRGEALPDALRRVEGEMRAVLQQRAAGVDPCPPPWDELGLAPRSDLEVMVVAPLRREAPRHLARPRGAVLTPGRAGWAWVRRPVVAAAAAIVVTLAGSLAATGGWPTTRVGDRPVGEIAAPGAPAFRPGAATPMWASGLDEPVAAARAYLATAGIDIDPAARNPTTIALRDAQGDVALVDWSTASRSRTWGGTVFLRASSDSTPRVWEVVGAASDDMSFKGVRYDGGRLSFTVTRVAGGDDELAVGVWADGRPVALDDDATTGGTGDTAAPPGVEPIAIGEEAGAERDIAIEADGATALVLIVYQVDAGRVRSLSHMAIGGPSGTGSGLGPSTSVAATPGVRRPGSTIPTTAPAAPVPDTPERGDPTTSIPWIPWISPPPVTPDMTAPDVSDITVPMPSPSSTWTESDTP